MEPETYDVLVIGSGGAGSAAALEATAQGASVLLVTRGPYLLSKTARAAGGIQAAIGSNDSPDLHFQDTLKAGEYQSNPDLARILAERAAETISWLEARGVTFDRGPSGYRLQQAGGLSHARILSCGDAAGKGIMLPLKKLVENSNVEVRSFHAVMAVSKSGDRFDVEVLDIRGDRTDRLWAKAVVIASGGAIPREKRSGMELPGGGQVPDSIELAEAIGAEVQHPDLMQYHPTGIVLPVELRRRPAPEVLRGAGASLRNKNGDVFCDPLLTRKKVCEAIVAECEKGNGSATEDGYRGVWLHTPEIDEQYGEGYTKRHFPSIYGDLLEVGFDMTQDPLLVYPTVHYSLGGISIDADAMSTVPGLFAAGEAAWGVHGADRLMGNSLLDVFVFGRIAGRSAASYARHGRI